MGIEKKLVFGHEARDKILNGIEKCGRTVAATFGPRGRLSVVYKGSIPYTTRDGAKTIQSISFKDELENIGASLIKEASTKANSQNGDGSTTVAILTLALCNRANELLKSGIDINQIIKDFERAKTDVLKSLEKYREPIKGEDDIRRVALISAHGDEEIADTVTKAFIGLGENGVVAVADSLSRRGKSDVIFSTGCDFERGFLSGQSVNTKSDTCDLMDPLVLLSSKPFTKFEDMTIYLQYANEKNLPIVFIAPDFDESCLAGFNGNLSKKAIQGAMIYTPGVSKSDINDRLRDLAVVLNAHILHEDIEPDKFKLNEHFGRCDQMIIHAGKTEIIGPHTNENDLEKHIIELKTKIELDDVDEAYSEFEIEKIKERLAHMSGGVATIKVGAMTQMELDEKKDRYDDAVNAVRAVLKEGTIPGAGTPLLLEGIDQHSNETPSYKAYLDAITVPARLLIKSSGANPEKTILEIIKKSKNDNIYGWDAREGSLIVLRLRGILDSYKVIRNDLIYATSVAITFATIDVAIISDLGSLSIKPADEVLQTDYFGGM
jgi:chaperonin GroEL